MLTERSIEHVVLERGEVANSWRRERWDSLRLLTPNSQSRLPGYRYQGPDPDGFMTVREVVDFIGGFAAAIDAPVRTHTEVTPVRPVDDGYRIVTRKASSRAAASSSRAARAIMPVVPALRPAVPSSIACFTPFDYRNPRLCPRAVCSSSARPPPGCSSPTRSSAPDGP